MCSGLCNFIVVSVIQTKGKDEGKGRNQGRKGKREGRSGPVSWKGEGLRRGSMDGSMDREENKTLNGGSREGSRPNQKRESKERVAWTTVVGVSFIDHSVLLFVVEVVDRSDTVSVILVDFLSLPVLFWRQRNQVGIILNISIFIQSDNALMCMVLVLESGSQTISCKETVCVVVSVNSSSKMFSSSVVFHMNIKR